MLFDATQTHLAKSPIPLKTLEDDAARGKVPDTLELKRLSGVTGGDPGHGHADISVQRLHVPTRKSRCWGESPELTPRPARRSDPPGTAGHLSFAGTRAELGHVGLGGQRRGTSLHGMLGFPRWVVPGSLCARPKATCAASQGHVCARPRGLHMVSWKEGRKEGGPWCCR